LCAHPTPTLHDALPISIFKEMKVLGQTVAPVADWRTKREWVQHAFAEFEKAGYTVTSAYAAVKNPARTRFLYRDLLWTGADMVGDRKSTRLNSSHQIIS